jgi:hypothetical protein
MTDDGDAKAEWARMQGLGGALQKRRTIATLAGTAVLAAGFLGSVVIFLFWPFDRVPIVALGAPIALMLPVAWGVRSKLWPKGQFR